MATDFVNVLPELADAEAKLRKNATAHGIEYRIADFGGLRTQADTARILKFRDDDYAVYLKSVPAGKAPIEINTWRPISPFGLSYHNYGAAFDILITSYPPNIGSADRALQVLKLAAPTVGLRSSVPNDPPHFELPITLAEAREHWAAFTGTKPVEPLAPPQGSAGIGILLAVAALGTLLVIAWKRGR